MRVEPNNGFSMSRIFSGTSRIGGVSLPDYQDFYFNTKTAPAMSDERFKDAIVRQAKEDAAAGRFQTDSAQYRGLMKSYVSVASPDRKNIITKALNSVPVGKNLPKTEVLSLFDLLFGKVTLTLTKDKAVNYAEFYDSNGELVASYSNGGWTNYETKAEAARSAEFLSIYNAAYKTALSESGNQVAASNGDEGSLDISV